MGIIGMKTTIATTTFLLTTTSCSAFHQTNPPFRLEFKIRASAVASTIAPTIDILPKDVNDIDESGELSTNKEQLTVSLSKSTGIEENIPNECQELLTLLDSAVSLYPQSPDSIIPLVEDIASSYHSRQNRKSKDEALKLIDEAVFIASNDISKSEDVVRLIFEYNDMLLLKDGIKSRELRNRLHDIIITENIQSDNGDETMFLQEENEFINHKESDTFFEKEVVIEHLQNPELDSFEKEEHVFIPQKTDISYDLTSKVSTEDDNMPTPSLEIETSSKKDDASYRQQKNKLVIAEETSKAISASGIFGFFMGALVRDMILSNRFDLAALERMYSSFVDIL